VETLLVGIVLGQVDQFQKDVGLFITIISKRSKTFVESYLKSSDGRHDSVSSPFGGTCIVFD